jgi:tRNA(fMet)-specific endonuclease VapC
VNRYLTLAGLRLNVGKMDLRIAAITLENGATVVTRNTRDFSRVPNLTVVDWSV